MTLYFKNVWAAETTFVAYINYLKVEGHYL